MSAGTNLLFRRSDLLDLPDLVLPAGYVLHAGAGNEAADAWCALITAAFGWSADRGTWQREIIAWEGYRPEGLQRILDPSGATVATALAARRGGTEHGYLHWVATHPSVRGMGLGRAASVAALHCLAADGCHDCVLITQAERRAAIALYRELGFELLPAGSAQVPR